jgi:hypothetical protein
MTGRMEPYRITVERRFTRGINRRRDYRYYPTHCYELAFKYLARHHQHEPNLRLVHGTLQIMGRLFPHAWVELPGRWVFEPFDHDFYDRDAYYRIEQAEAERIYTATEAGAETLRTGHWGPWSPEETTDEA